MIMYGLSRGISDMYNKDMEMHLLCVKM